MRDVQKQDTQYREKHKAQDRKSVLYPMGAGAEYE